MMAASASLYSFFFSLSQTLNNLYPDQFYKQFIENGLSKDPLFHMAIANMIYYLKVPTTGLHFAPYLGYHYLGHWLMAAAIGLTNLKIYEFYGYFNSFILIPLLILALDLFYEKQLGRRKFVAHFLTGLLLFGPAYDSTLWSDFKTASWFNLGDPTVPIALVISVLYFASVESKSRWMLLFAPLGFVAKGPLGFIITGSEIFKSLFCFAREKKEVFLRLAILAVLGIFSLKYFSFRPQGNSMDFTWFYYFKTSFAGLNAFQVITDQFFILWCLILVLVLSKKTFLQIEFFPIATSLAIVLVVAHFPLWGGGSQSHFVIFVNWLSLLAFVPRTLNTSGLSQKFLIPVFIYAGYLATRNIVQTDYFLDFTEKRAQIYKHRMGDLYQIDLKGAETCRKIIRPYLDAFKNFDPTDPAHRFLVDVPESETEFWNCSLLNSYGSRYFMPFLIPIVAERAAFNGYNPSFMYAKPVGWNPTGLYGYARYYRPWPQDPCNFGFQGIFRVAKQNGVVATSTSQCP